LIGAEGTKTPAGEAGQVRPHRRLSAEEATARPAESEVPGAPINIQMNKLYFSIKNKTKLFYKTTDNVKKGTFRRGMSVRINDMRSGLITYQNQQNRTNINNNTQKKPNASVDVEISSRGREIAQAMKSEQAQRQERVQELKQQIANGSYHVDSSKIAEKMIGFWK
jgi:negative regulator of flagellin synthesis FlgM